MQAHAAFRQEVDALLLEAVASLGLGPLPTLEVPPDPAMGDAGLPCFVFAKALRKSPPAVATDLAARMKPHGWVAAIQAAGPYVNFTMDRARAASELLRDPESSLAPSGPKQRILLEHTSANPNGPLHVGRARNPIVGDTLARILRAAGHEVEVQYYMDNLGRQVATLAWGKWNLATTDLPPKTRDKIDHDLVRCYQVAHDRSKSDPAVAASIKKLVEELESADAALLARVRPVYGACFEGMKASLQRLGAHYDSVKDESDVVLDGSVAKVIADLKRLPIAGVDETGANFLDLSHLLKGQKDKFFFTRRDGTSVYATRDIAYHAWKAAQGRRLIDVLGEDHRLQSLQVGAALQALGVERPTVVFYAFVSLPEGKMSTRANRVVFIDDLLDEAADRAYEEVKKRRPELAEADLRRIAEAVGIAAIRFNIARVQPEKAIQFKWEEALDFEGDSAPYIQYAYARCSSLLRMCKTAGLTTAGAAAPEAGEVKLLATVGRFQPTLQESVTQLAPHRVCAYALALAGAVNEYYRDHRVLECEDKAQQALRLRTFEVARLALGKTLAALGLPALEEM